MFSSIFKKGEKDKPKPKPKPVQDQYYEEKLVLPANFAQTVMEL